MLRPLALDPHLEETRTGGRTFDDGAGFPDMEKADHAEVRGLSDPSGSALMAVPLHALPDVDRPGHEAWCQGEA